VHSNDDPEEIRRYLGLRPGNRIEDEPHCPGAGGRSVVIGFDTNLLVRYLVRDHAAQATHVERLIAETVERDDLIYPPFAATRARRTNPESPRPG
jgi:hypothetical protein